MSDPESGLSDELKQQIAEFQKERLPQIPAEIREVLFRTTEDQVKSGIAANALKVGDRAPDFTLPNLHGETVTLSDLLGQGPAVVAFYRGSW